MSNPDGLKFERALKADIEEILALEKICFNEDAFSKKQFYYLVKKAKGEFIVVRKKEKIIAYLITLKRKNSKHYRIYSIAIDPNERGLGLGKRLLIYSEKIALENNTHKISLEVNETNKAAISLYEKMGYKKTGSRPNYYANGSPALIMTKEF